MTNTAKIDFLYLNEKDMIDAGVLDAEACVETMEETMKLFGKHDFLLGGPNADEHGLQVNFPATSEIEDFPLDDGPDRRFMAMPAYLGGKYHVAGQKYYGSNSRNLPMGLPRSILMVTLSDVQTGAPIALMSANLLSAMRTGAMPAMSAKYLANSNPTVLSLIGPGAIQKCALNCYMSVLPTIDTIKIKGSSKTSKSAIAMQHYIEANFPKVKQIILCETLEEACMESDIVSEAMSVARDAKIEFKKEWFKKGATVFSMGSFYMKDMDSCMNTTMVVDNYGMYEKYMRNFNARGPFDENGEKREWCIMGMHFIHLVNEQKVERQKVLNLSDIVNSIVPGRTSDEEIVFCSIGGMPLEDLSWGYACYEKAKELGIGTTLNLWDEPYLK